MNKFLKDIAIMATRAQADMSKHSCFTASLAEIAISTGARRVVSLDELDRAIVPVRKGRTPPSRFFDHLRKGADVLGLEVVDVIINPHLLGRLDDPTAQSITARTVIGKIPDVPNPHIKIMANSHGDDHISLHSELDNGDSRTAKRIQSLESRGWYTTGAILLRPNRKQSSK